MAWTSSAPMESGHAADFPLAVLETLALVVA